MTYIQPTGSHPRRPRVLVVGGDDVDARLDLMSLLSAEFELAAAGSTPALEGEFLRHGFGFTAFPMKRGVSPLSDLGTFLTLYRIFRRERPDIVHAYATKPAVWGRLAARAAGVKVIVGTIPGLGSLYSRGSRWKRVVRGVYAWLKAKACDVSNATIFQNERDRSEMIDQGVVSADRAVLIPGSGVRTDEYDRHRVPLPDRDAVRASVGAGPEDVVVTMVARLIRPKGVLEYADAARRLRGTHPSARFVLVGPADQKSVDRLTEDEMRAVQESVVWLGPRDDVAVVLAASDLFVLPSYYREGMPRVLLEAGSMGLPLIAARAPGSEDIVVDGRTGFLVEPQDVDGLARAVARLLDEPALRQRLGDGARRRTVERFETRAIADLTATLYRNLLAGRPAGTPAPRGGSQEGRGTGVANATSPDARH